uniref:HECT-type E3 ubiquitin transferase n=1 Tax=Caenorhabditis japonica TaxID=281687 RepID=A0A8R1IB69_CAEJA
MPRYRRNDVSVQVSRNRVFSDSFRELFRLRPSEWKNRFYIIFQGEEGQDAGGLLREWFSVITREIFNPNYALFITAPGDMVTYMINKASYINPEHLDYFKFVGRLIAKSVFEHKYLDCYFTRAFYKHILNLPVRYQDLESEDPAFFKSLDFLLQNPIDDLALDLTFSTEVEEFGVRSVRDLKPNGRKIEVTDANKDEYVKLVCQMKMTGSIRQQLDAFLTGFYEIIPKDLISMFNEQELELLISGLPTVDIDDMAANTDYKGYQKTSTHIQWFWRALRSFEKEDKAKFLQFVTGTSKRSRNTGAKLRKLPRAIFSWAKP